MGTNKNDSFVLNLDKNKIKSSTEVTLPGIKIDKKLQNLNTILKNDAKKLPIACFA